MAGRSSMKCSIEVSRKYRLVVFPKNIFKPPMRGIFRFAFRTIYFEGNCKIKSIELQDAKFNQKNILLYLPDTFGDGHAGRSQNE